MHTDLAAGPAATGFSAEIFDSWAQPPIGSAVAGRFWGSRGQILFEGGGESSRSCSLPPPGDRGTEKACRPQAGGAPQGASPEDQECRDLSAREGGGRERGEGRAGRVRQGCRDRRVGRRQGGRMREKERGQEGNCDKHPIVAHYGITMHMYPYM